MKDTIVKKCENCIELEKKLLGLARRYEQVVTASYRGKTIEDIDRGIAEQRLIDICRENGVFSIQSADKSYGGGQGVKQSVNIDNLRAVLERLPTLLRY